MDSLNLFIVDIYLIKHHHIKVCSEQAADKISPEIFSHLCYMSEGYGCRTSEGYIEFILYIFSNLQDAVNDPTMPENITGRYCALVYLIMSHFMDLNYRLVNGGVGTGGPVGDHVIPALDALQGDYLFLGCFFISMSYRFFIGMLIFY